MDETYLQEQITATKALIAAYDAAILALIGGAESYTLNTGQNTQSVKKHNISELNNTLDALYNRLTILTARVQVFVE